MDRVTCFSWNSIGLVTLLEEMGYRKSVTFSDDELILWTGGGNVFYSTNNLDIIQNYDVGDFVLPYGINCLDEFDMFVSIAAIGVPGDKHKWFTCIYDDSEPGEEISMFQCFYDKVDEHIHNEMDGWDVGTPRPSTLEEVMNVYMKRRSGQNYEMTWCCNNGKVKMIKTKNTNENE